MKSFARASIICSAFILCAAFMGCDRRTLPEKPNIVVILVDTLRFDHLGYAGYPRNTSPNIDRLAAESLNFRYAYAGSSWTAPSVATLFTGYPPSVHGMMPPNSRVKAAEKFSFRLPLDVTTVAEKLKESGYKTAAVSSNEWVSEKFGYRQGFDHFFMKSRMNGSEVNSEASKIADSLLEKNDPFFLYVHYFDPHDPYEAPAPFDKTFTDTINADRYGPREQELIRAYDNEIRYVDEQIGKLLDHLKAKGRGKEPVVILTADHGEQFKERGNVGHGFTLHDEEVRTPLLIHIPGRKGAVISAPVSHVDLYPTLVDLAGGKLLEKGPGVSLLADSFPKRTHEVVAEVARRKNQKALVTQNLGKVIGEYELGAGLYAPLASEQRIELFNLEKDPLERSPVTEGRELDASAEQYFKAFGALGRDFKRRKVDSMEMSDETLEELKTLGYL